MGVPGSVLPQMWGSQCLNKVRKKQLSSYMLGWWDRQFRSIIWLVLFCWNEPFTDEENPRLRKVSEGTQDFQPRIKSEPDDSNSRGRHRVLWTVSLRLAQNGLEISTSFFPLCLFFFFPFSAFFPAIFLECGLQILGVPPWAGDFAARGGSGGSKRGAGRAKVLSLFT